MFSNNYPLILASASPRRRRFLEQLGLEFSIQAANVSEKVGQGEYPRDFVGRIAMNKALMISKANPSACVLGADTVVVLDGEILGKPDGEKEALEILKRLSGRTHEVWTGYSIIIPEGEGHRTGAVVTEVTFINADEDILKSYVASGEPLDKAGSYGIQGKGGILVSTIRGSYSNVVGLPMAEVISELLSLEMIRLQV